MNYANDYSDGTRGTDAERVGPMRLVGSGAAAPRQVLIAAGLAFAVAAVAGLGLAALSSWWLVAVGAVCIAAAWTYTGGPLPYGYRALGEVFVFVFFGLVAVVGTTFVQTGTLPGLAFAVAVPIGLLIVAILVVNNLRDIHGDALVGKRTLAVLLGERATRIAFAGLFVVAFAVIAAVGVARPWALLGLLAAPLAVPPARVVLSGGRGPALIARPPGHRPAHPGDRGAARRRAGAQRLSLLGSAQPAAEVLLGRPPGDAARGQRLGQPLPRGAQEDVGDRQRQQEAEQQPRVEVEAGHPEHEGEQGRGCPAARPCTSAARAGPAAAWPARPPGSWGCCSQP